IAAIALGDVSQVLVRAAQDFAAAGHNEPVTWLTTCAEAAYGDLNMLNEIAEELPKQTLVLRELAARLAQVIVDRLRGAAQHEDSNDAAQASLGAALVSLGVRLSDIGYRQDALVATEEAVAIYRSLAARSRHSFSIL